MNHDTLDAKEYIAVSQAIQRTCFQDEESCIHAVCDGRKDGTPSGF